jgi:hypothetical protein
MTPLDSGAGQMSSPEKLRVQAQELYTAAGKIEDEDARMNYIMLAMKLLTEAEVLESGRTLPSSLQSA